MMRLTLKTAFTSFALQCMAGLVIFCSSVVYGNEGANKLELQSTFQGDQEQPKVLYILPWKKIDSPANDYQLLQSLIGENFTRIDRDEFLREVQYKGKFEDN